MRTRIFGLFTVTLLFFLIFSSCSNSSNVPIIEFTQPTVPDASIFDIDFQGMEVRTSEKSAELSGLFVHENPPFSATTSEWNPFSTAMVILHDYFRRGMVNNLRYIYINTFDFGENPKPVQDGNRYIWNYSAKIFDPENPGILNPSELRLTADVTISEVTWNLFKTGEEADQLIAKGYTYPNQNSGKWEFLYHDDSGETAFEFEWILEYRRVLYFAGSLRFVDVTAEYESTDVDSRATIDMKDKPLNPVLSKITWKKFTGEGSINLQTLTINETKCWDSERRERADCEE